MIRTREGWGARIAALAAICAFAAMGSAARAESADDVIDAHIKAVGGLDAIAKIKSIARKGETAVSGMFGDMAGTTELVVIPWKKAFQSMDLGVFAQKMGFNGEVAWQDSSMEGTKTLEGEEAGQIRTMTAIDPLVGYRLKKEGEIALIEDAKVGEDDHHVLEMTPASGPKIKLFVHKGTKMLTQVSLDQDNPQFGPVTITLGSADFADYNGIKLPNTSTVKIGEDMLSLNTKFTETKINGEVDDKLFELPPPPPPPAAPAEGAAPAAPAAPANP